MISRAAALRSRLEFRIRHLSTQHPSDEIKAQAAELIDTPSAEGFRRLWIALNLYGPILLIEDVLIDIGLDICSSVWGMGHCDV
ncbi:hypothetical protein [Devosia sp. A449]